jgi:predicted HAD superfamily Cof-like phosphohydrolase
MTNDAQPKVVDHMVDDVFTFNEHVIGLPSDLQLNPLTEGQVKWLDTFVREELSEFHEAVSKQDIVGMVDAVWDLIYGSMGTLKKMGLTREQATACFAAVHNANMGKKRGDKGRGSDEDATKPDGFVPPDEAIGLILFGGTGV